MKKYFSPEHNPKISALCSCIKNPAMATEEKPHKLVQLVRAILITAKEFQTNNLSLRAGALTYTILLSLVPILAMSTAVVKGLGGGGQLRQVAYSYISTLEQKPFFETTTDSEETSEEDNSEITAHLRSAVDQIFDYVDRTNFATLGSFGVAGIFLSVILVLSHIETAMNAIWKVTKGRSLIRKISDYLTLLILVPISINIAFAASAFLNNPALSSKIDFLIPIPIVQTLILKFIPVFFIALTLYVIYLFFPNTKVKTLPAVLGAFIAGLAWFAVQNVYISLQVGVANYNAIYGSFATVPLFLVWIYLGWVFILAGAQFTFALQNNLAYDLDGSEETPALKLSAAFDIMEKVQEAFNSNTRLTTEHLLAELAIYPSKHVYNIIAKLKQGGALYLVDDQYLVPAAPEKRINQQTLVNLTMGENTPDTTGGKQSMTILNAARNA